MTDDIEAWFRETYGLDLVDDILMEKHQISLFADLESAPVMVHVVSGDMKTLGLPLKATFAFKDLIPYIQSDNTLSEVQGRKTFIRDFITRILNIETQRILHIPIHSGDKSLWLRILFKVIRRKHGRPGLIYAQVIRAFDHVPDLVLYYKKTHQDTLTKLFTRETLKKHLDTRRHKEGVFGMYIDLDNFKRINDEWGHLEGDRLLTRIAETLIGQWEENVVYYRLGGDEFFVYIYHFDEQSALSKARDIIATIETVGKTSGMDHLSASLGMVPITPETGYHTLLDASDKAMYASKARGNGNITLIDQDRVIAYDSDRQKRILTKRTPPSNAVD